VRAIVRGGLPASEKIIRKNLPASVSRGDRDHFISLVREEFKTMHAGNAVRYGLRPLEFETWKTASSEDN
jgi:hypothetical protein